MPTTGVPWTLADAFFSRAKFSPNTIAFRAKERGVWRSWTNSLAAEETGRLAAGMSKLGVSEGDHVGIIGPNNPRLYMAILATQTISAVPVLFHPDVRQDEICQHQAINVLRLVFGNNLNGTSAVTKNIADTKNWIGTVVFEQDDALQLDDGKSIIYDSILNDGANVIEEQQGWLEKSISELNDSKIALKSITVSSDSTTREVKLNHAMIRRAIDVLSPLKAFGSGEDVLAFLPMSHYADQLQFFCAITGGATLNTPESTLTVFVDIRDILPTVMIATPPIYAKFRGLHEDRISLASRPMKFIVSRALATAERVSAGQGKWSFLGLIGRWLLLKPIRRQMGFESLKIAITTQSVLPEYLRRFFGSLGVNLTNLYGKASFAGALAISDGQAFSTQDQSLDITEDGRLIALVDGRAASCLTDDGGLNRPETPVTIETGDVAVDQDGTWSFAGRLESQLTLEDGRSFQPGLIERRLADTPFIRAVFVSGKDSRKLTVIVLPAMDRLFHWARQELISFANAAELLDDSRTRALYQRLISEVNAEIRTTNDDVRIHRALVLPGSTDYLSRHGGVQRQKLADLAANPTTVLDTVSPSIEFGQIHNG